VPLPLRLYPPGKPAWLAAGTTVDVSAGGLLAQCRFRAAPEPGDPVDVELGPEADAVADCYELLPARVRRVEPGEPALCAVEFVGQAPPFLLAPELVGRHPSVVELKRELIRVAAQDVNVLIRGEGGTGRGLAARIVHRHSRRAARPFARLNCRVVPDALFEATLFGCERDVLPGSSAARPGLLRIAHGGSLLLEEVAALPARVQLALLTFIEERQFLPAGASDHVRADVRLLATTCQNLDRLARERAFRQDLLYRLSEAALIMPPLRERASDIPLLAGHLFARFRRGLGRAVGPPAPAVIGALCTYSWPGNVRELEEAVRRNVLAERPRRAPSRSVSPPPPVAIEPGPEPPAGWQGPGPPELRTMRQARRRAVEAAERLAVVRALAAAHNDKNRAAGLLGVSYRTFQRKIRQYGIKP